MIEYLIKTNIVTQREILIGVGVLIFSLLVTSIVKKVKRNFPPGPIGLPIVGYLPFMTDKPYLKLLQLSKKYGDVFSVTLGSKSVIVLNNVDDIKEALLNSESLGRPPYGAFALFKKQSPFFAAPVHIWKEQRRFVVQSMKDLGLGKTKIEEHIKDEVSAFLEVLSSQEGKPINVVSPVSSSTSNNICALIFGARYPYNHSTRKFLDKNLNEVNAYLGQTSLYEYIPWMRHIPFLFKKSSFETAATAFNVVEQYLRDIVKEHEDTLDSQHSRDFVDSYLIQMKSIKERNPNTTFNEETLVESCLDLFGAGSETVRTTLSWCIYIAAAYPDIQKKVQKEILEVIGSEKRPEFSDQKSMPFTHAFILEVLRWVTIVPLNLLHYTTGDITIRGYDIPRNTSVLANFWAAHHDPKHWKDPHVFKPERFLSKDHNSVVKPPNYMPFSMGKRVCPGETMAYMEIFLYFTSILQKYDVIFKPGTKPTFETKLSLTLSPQPFEVQFLERETSF